MKIIVCLTASIAVEKSIKLILKLKEQHEVKVISTKNALNFFDEDELGGIEIYHDLFSKKEMEDITHISLTDWTDLVVIAPATYNLVGKVANGIADDLLTSFLAANEKPVIIAPAMNNQMYENEIFQKNLETLNYLEIKPTVGKLACGTFAIGRMEEPEKIIKKINEFINNEFKNKKVIVTSGGTNVYLDDIRYITTKATGKMGYEIAKTFTMLGADVIFMTANADLKVSGAKNIYTETVEKLHKALENEFETCDYLIMNAAVSDYKTTKQTGKIKKQSEEVNIKLEKEIDILKSITKNKKEQFIVGFAADENDQYALEKLKTKKMDLIVFNNILTMGSEEITPTLITKNKKVQLEKLTKKEFAQKLVEFIKDNR